MHSGVVGPSQILRMNSRMILEKSAIKGDSPVSEILKQNGGILSTAEQVEFCGNLPGPPGKAKYSSVTDSEPVP